LIPHMAARLENVGVSSALKGIAQHLLNGKGQEAYDMVAHLAKFFDNIGVKARELTDGRTRPNPERERLNSDRQSFEKEKSAHFDSTIGTEVNRLTTLSTSKVVSQFVKDAGLKGEGAKEFVGGLMKKIFAAMKADQTFQRQFDAIKRK